MWNLKHNLCAYIFKTGPNLYRFGYYLGYLLT
jgi:hypothetical protein